MSATKESIAKLDGITQLVKLATRCQKRYTILLTTSQVNFRPRRLSDSQDDKNSAPFERDCNNLPVRLAGMMPMYAKACNLASEGLGNPKP